MGAFCTCLKTLFDLARPICFLCLLIFLTEIKCPVLNTIANGAFVPNCTGSVNSVCRFTCEQFYSPFRNLTQMTCQPSGTWNGDVTSICVRKLFSFFCLILCRYEEVICITKTCLYNTDPLKPHFYIVKLGFKGVYIIFLISAQNIDCGYSLESPRRGDSNEYPQSMF